MIAFDPYMNLVLADCEEFRRIRPKNPLDPPREEKRTLGLVILRGDNIVSMSVEAPPPPNEEARRKAAAQVNTGGGIGRPAGRGIGIMVSQFLSFVISQSQLIFLLFLLD